MPEFLKGPNGRIAHHLSAGRGLPVFFLGGFRSDMTGTKALFLEGWARARGRPFLRFDYSGHGASDGRFEDGCIGDWLADARAALGLIPGPKVLVGSSMGGWLALLIARDDPAQVAGLVTIAAAPDFTRWSFADQASDAQRADLARQGWFEAPSDYGAPYRITRRLLDEAEAHLILPHLLDLPMPVRFLQGTADADVPAAIAARLLERASGPDLQLTLLKGADHRFSSDQALALIGQAIGGLSVT